MRPLYGYSKAGFQVRLLSPLGSYPLHTFSNGAAAIAIYPDICFSIVDWTEEEGFSEIDNLTPAEIPILGAIMLCVEKGERPIYPYPTHQSLLLRKSDSQDVDAGTIAEAANWLRAYVKRKKLEYGLADLIHRPPAAGGAVYEFIPSEERNESRITVLRYLNSATQVYLRGVVSLLKANMAWNHLEFGEAACISLWVALDAAHSIIMRRLRDAGNSSPTSQDAAQYVYKAYGISGVWEKFFEDDYQNRIRFIHPDNRFGAEARRWLIADDFYELNENLIDLYYFFATGFPRDRQA